jgi:ribonuclease R
MVNTTNYTKFNLNEDKMNQETILNLFQQTGKPLKFNEIADILNIETKKDRTKLKRLLRKLIKKGELHITKSHTYCFTTEANLVKGVIEFNPNGFAFLIPDEQFKIKDIFLKPPTLLEALHGDRALVRIDKFRKDKSPEGTVVNILERGLTEVVGIFTKNKGFGFVEPFDKRIVRDFYIPKGKFKNAVTGDVVLMKILEYPTKHYNPVGEIIKVLGKQDSDSTIFSSINIKYGIKEKFPKNVVKKSNELLEKEYKRTKNRKDIRHIKFLTIDGLKARDFDDAVAIEKLDNGNFKLFVSIADVEFYVKENQSIDKEAYKRATSVYYPHTVYPMLPEALSNNLCSLNPNEDKFSFTVEMDISKTGEVFNYNIYKSVIKSYFRASYEEIGELLKSPSKELKEKYSSVHSDIDKMIELADILRRARFKKGSIDFNLPEVEIDYDLKGNVKDIHVVKRNIAHILIEEFMLIANEIVAEFLTKKNIPLLYRVHETPDIDKLNDVSRILSKFGIYKKILSPVDIQNVLNEVKDKPYEKLFNYLLLRCMKQAKYSPENIGHYALAKSNYTHFTSPIRRYPDLINHRILRRTINNKITSKYIDNLSKYLIEAGRHCSERERSAEQAERDVVDYMKMKYMEDKIGEDFNGTVSGVNSFGFFVELDDILVEGLVPLRELTDDYYQYVESEYLVRGKKRGNFYRLGDRVAVKLVKIDKTNKYIDFSIIKKL